MKVLHIIGADLSKRSIDFATPQGDHLKVTNDPPGYDAVMKWIIKQSIDVADVMMVMEHTGLYSYQLEQFLHLHQVRFTKIPAMAIKHSLGIVRGKNDKIDAKRIARYGQEKQATLVAETPVDKRLQRLQMLHGTRDRLVRTRASMISAVKEYQQTCGLKKTDLIISGQLQIIKSLDHQIAKLNNAMDMIVESEPTLKKNAELLQSITAVGKVVALAMIIKTRNFTRFANARKFSCHCGTAPFEHTSGSSIRGKTQVSHLADKTVKRLLDLSAKSAIQYDKELREYYLKRTASGKSKMSTINVVRCKILYRMFAVIKRQTPFIKDHLQTA
jgi:transposase